MNNQVKAAIYARVSTDHKGQNPETQLGELREYCQRRQWPYVEYVDVGASGSTTDRPALNKLQTAIHRREVTCVICWKFDRLARNVRELLNLADDWDKRNVDLISTTEQIDTTSPGGRAIFAIMAVIAEFERATLIERVNAGLARARREGKRLCRPKSRVHIPPVILGAVQAGGMSIYQAAKATGIPRTTLARRLKARGVIDSVSENSETQYEKTHTCGNSYTSHDDDVPKKVLLHDETALSENPAATANQNSDTRRGAAPETLDYGRS